MNTHNFKYISIKYEIWHGLNQAWQTSKPHHHEVMSQNCTCPVVIDQLDTQKKIITGIKHLYFFNINLQQTDSRVFFVLLPIHTVSWILCNHRRKISLIKLTCVSPQTLIHTLILILVWQFQHSKQNINVEGEFEGCIFLSIIILFPVIYSL